MCICRFCCPDVCRFAIIHARIYVSVAYVSDYSYNAFLNHSMELRPKCNLVNFLAPIKLSCDREEADSLILQRLRLNYRLYVSDVHRQFQCSVKAQISRRSKLINSLNSRK